MMRLRNLFLITECQYDSNRTEQFIASNQNSDKEGAFRIYMDKMNSAEKSVQENGYYSEEDVEEELSKI